MTISRRTFLAAAGATAGAGLLSACGSGTKATTGLNGAATSLQVFSWWTAGGELQALDALKANFNLHNPNIQFVNEAVAGGAGTNAKALLAKRLAAGQPPDTFQAQAGEMVGDYITAGQLEDVTFLYQQNGWDKTFNQDVLKLIQRNGRYYSVPVDIHHINVLWSNRRLCDKLSIPTGPKTIPEFIDALGKAHDAGHIPLAISRDPSESWQLQHVMEAMLIGTLGAAGWSALWHPGADWSSAKVTQALDYFHQVMQHAPGTGGNMSWDQVSAQVAKGQAAYQIMGDWTEASFTVTFNLQPHIDYDWAPSPGTAGIFDFASDCFTLPKGAKHRDATIAWLTECGSQEGQDSFTTVKGAIPPRAHVGTQERTLFDTYLQWSLDEWTKDTIVGSLTHGVMAPGAWNNDILTAIGGYLTDPDTGKLQSALVQAATKHFSAV
ncbi:carbohydrate ABC transporter substrate-binding protein [Streptacidiphilus sp. PB12-B1b]|uniref:ABC transporter substrate-binding protein n=1 Tax=Streptacidiphilus sp. PB12-B1b TaxID=2705012 RepID=UPI0015F9CDCB|nr:ABC transporter substrate-binding protein [Streptacidiphilus sp. PB12-B1b]QMU75020.1 carbohydrate ABC transporter substrate-binding protein [Streptacidiphilus sp. PB12-B1b]